MMPERREPSVDFDLLEQQVKQSRNKIRALQAELEAAVVEHNALATRARWLFLKRLNWGLLARSIGEQWVDYVPTARRVEIWKRDYRWACAQLIEK